MNKVVEWLESEQGEAWSSTFHKSIKCAMQGTAWFQLREYRAYEFDGETGYLESPVATYLWGVTDAADVRDLIPAQSGVAT